MAETETAYVTSEASSPCHPITGGSGTVRVTIDRGVGCENLIQRVFRFRPGRSPEMRNESSEEVFYVISGNGHAMVGGKRHPLGPGTALFVPPGWPYTIENSGHEELPLLSILSPQPGRPAGLQTEAELRPDELLTVVEDAEEPVPAGDDRVFKLLIDRRYGCRNLTQFVGTIRPGRAPAHTHTYEEVVYILDGAGIAHVGDASQAIETGSCIYLPPGMPHCLENSGSRALRLLEVFCPAGSPAAKREVD